MKIKSIKKVILSSEKQYYDVVEANPYNNFIIKTNTSKIISHNCNFTDECNFSLMSNPEKQKVKMLKLVTQIDARMKSRFLRGTYLPTLNLLASSADTEQSFLQAYIANKQKNESKNTLIVNEPQWIVDNRKDSPVKFYVAIGNKFLPNELLPLDVTSEQLDEYRAKGYELWQVPWGYLDTFQQNLDEAICSIIGIATASSLKYISGVKLNEVKVDSYKNPFVKDVIEVGNAKDDLLQYSNFFDLSQVSEEDKARPLFIHLDMSTGSGGKGDKTGIAGVWITGKTPNNKLLPAPNSMASQDEIDETNLDMAFKLAFSVSIKAPKGAQISFAKNRNFIRWLRDQGFAIKSVSCDQFQSANIQQDLLSDGFKVEQLSVDRLVRNPATNRSECLPYKYLKAAIFERRIQMYQKCDLLTDELIDLERKSDGHIDHPQSGCFTGDTKISLVDGREVPILELVNEFNSGKTNFVYSFNETMKRIEPKQIEKAWCTIKNANLVEVELDSGEKIKCTPNHLFMLRDGSYVKAEDLKCDDSLMPLDRLDRKYLTVCNEILNRKVKSIKHLEETQDVYDLTIADNHNFALSCGIFVHNSKDQADAFCGAVFAASKFSDEYSYSYGDNVIAALDANEDESTNDNFKRQQLVVNFEEELKKISLFDSNSSICQSNVNIEQQDEYQNYADILDGILVF